MSHKQRRATAKLSWRQSDTHAGSLAAVGSAVTKLLATGVQHHQAGRLAEAEACYRRVLTARPNHSEAQSNLGVALRAQGKLDGAIAAYRQAIGIKPDYVRAHLNLGNALKEETGREAL